MGSIDRNESDFAFAPPVMDYFGPNVLMENVATADVIMIDTVYRPLGREGDSPKNESTHVLDFLSGYSMTHWYCTLLFAALICCLMWLALRTTPAMSRAERVRRQAWPPIRRALKMKRLSKKKSIKTTANVLISCVLKQHSNCSSLPLRFAVSITYTVLTLLAFFSALFLTSMISTEMVVLKPPPVYRTYQDLLDHDVVPVWHKFSGDAVVFEKAKPGSDQRRIWDQAVKRGINQSILDLGASIGPEAMSSMRPLVNRVMERKVVGLCNDIITRSAVSNACALKSAHSLDYLVNAFYRKDPHQEETLRVFPMFAGISLEKRKFLRRMRRHKIIGSGLFQELITKRFEFYIANNDKDTRAVAECMANVILMPKVEHVAVPLSHYYDLSVLCLSFLSFAVIVLTTESCFSWKRGNQSAATSRP